MNKTEGTMALEGMKIGSKEFEKMFPIVAIEQLSLRDSFMKYAPDTLRESIVKKHIIEAKQMGMKNFRKAAIDPSFADDKTIIYCKGKQPAVNESAVWWDENARKILPEKNSRLINQQEKSVFLGTLIKYLVERKKYKVKTAWEMVCVNSCQIGHYADSPQKYKNRFETTGNRKVDKWYDLANTCKFVKGKDEEYLVYGGNYESSGSKEPLADWCYCEYPEIPYECSVGEIVLDI